MSKRGSDAFCFITHKCFLFPYLARNERVLPVKCVLVLFVFAFFEVRREREGGRASVRSSPVCNPATAPVNDH